MRICAPQLEGRISPVLDVAKTMLVIDLDNRTVAQSFEARCNEAHPLAKARRIIELRPDVVICGAVSQEFESALRASGIELYPNRCGGVEEVVQALLTGELEKGKFLMPGCCGRRRWARQGEGRGTAVPPTFRSER